MRLHHKIVGIATFVAQFSRCVVVARSQAQHDDDDHHHHHHRRELSSLHGDHRCATPAPSLRDQLIDQLRFRGAFDPKHVPSSKGRRQLQTTDCSDLCDQCIEIETHLHLIQGNVTGLGVIFPHPTETVLNRLGGDTTIGLDDFSTRQQIINLFRANMAVANEAFGGTPFAFRFVPERTTVTVNNDWSNYAIDYRQEMSRAVGSGNLRQLDVFVVWTVGTNSSESSSTGTILGIASLPGAQIAGEGDGLVVRYDVLTGGGLNRNDLGYTLVHEMGHWLGLLHTFQSLVSSDACNADEEDFGDFVDDTPVQDGPSSELLESCTEYLGGAQPPDTCPNLSGRDAIHNFMNYVDNELCQAAEGRFTCGQIERMYRHWLLFRDHVTVCEDPTDMELEVVVELDASYTTENRIILATVDGDILFDSLVDHAVAALIFGTETFLIDLCVPRDQRYVLSIEDIGGNDFLDGSVEVYVDRVLAGRVTGNFGDLETIEIDAGNAQGITVETPSPNRSRAPTSSPTRVPTWNPTSGPTAMPTENPTFNPSTDASEPNTPPSTTEPTSTMGDLSSTEVDLNNPLDKGSFSDIVDLPDRSMATPVSVSLASGIGILLWTFL